MVPLTDEEERALRLVKDHFGRSLEVPQAFFEREAGPIAVLCRAMAGRFRRGGRLLAFGSGASASDALHIAVEFVHPVIVGKRAMPGLALNAEAAGLSFAQQLAAFARPVDIAVGISADGRDRATLAGLAAARSAGLLTVGLTGGEGGSLAGDSPDFLLVVPSPDPLVVQETHKTLYHILWEQVQVFFEHEGLLDEPR